MTADDLRSIPEACDAAGNCVGWVPVPVAARDALAALIDAARVLVDNVAEFTLDIDEERLRDALAALAADR